MNDHNTELQLLDFDDAADFSAEVLAEKRVRLILQTPSGKDMSYSYNDEDGNKVTKVQYIELLSDQSKRYKKAKSKLTNAAIQRKGRAKYSEEEDIQRTSNLIASVTTHMHYIENGKIIDIDNEDGSKQYDVRDVYVKYPEFREQASEIINNRAEYLGNSNKS